MTALSMPGMVARGGSNELPAPTVSLSTGKKRVRLRRQYVARTILFCFTLVLLGILLMLPPPTRLRRAWRRGLHWYLRVLHVHPFTARAVSAGGIFFVADLAAQRLCSKGGNYICGRRLMRYTMYGMGFMGPFLYIWYSIMNEYGPDDDVKGSLQKCLFEQITLEPFCIIVYIFYDGVVCRRDWKIIKRRMEIQFIPLWFKNAVFWMPANFCNYYIGTPDLRVVFANLCSLFWNAYFSTKINNPVQTKSQMRSRSQGSGIGKYTPVAEDDDDDDEV